MVENIVEDDVHCLVNWNMGKQGLDVQRCHDSLGLSAAYDVQKLVDGFQGKLLRHVRGDDVIKLFGKAVGWCRYL